MFLFLRKSAGDGFLFFFSSLFFKYKKKHEKKKNETETEALFSFWRAEWNFHAVLFFLLTRFEDT